MLAAVSAQQVASGAGSSGLPPGGVALIVVIGVIALAVLGGWVSWRFTTYVVGADTVRVDSGVLFRRTRQVRLDRVQTIEVVRPGVARVLGLAELRLETAGGEATAAPLAYLSERDALVLRAELLARSAGLGPATPEAPERVLHTVRVADLLVSRLLQLPFLVTLAVGVVLLVVAARVGLGALAASALPALAGLVWQVGHEMANSYGFTVAASPDGLRLRHGLIETRAETVPPGRVQAVALIEPWLWRRVRGWCRLEVNVAGRVGAGEGETTLLLPVARREVALMVVSQVLPTLDLGAIPLAPAPARARWVDPLAAPVLGLGADEHHVVTRTGRLQRVTVVVPHERIQSVRVRQGPLARRLGLATVAFDSTPGPVHPAAPHRDAAEARAVWESEVTVARTSRAHAVPARWMTAPPVS